MEEEREGKNAPSEEIMACCSTNLLCLEKTKKKKKKDDDDQKDPYSQAIIARQTDSLEERWARATHDGISSRMQLGSVTRHYSFKVACETPRHPSFVPRRRRLLSLSPNAFRPDWLSLLPSKPKSSLV